MSFDYSPEVNSLNIFEHQSDKPKRSLIRLPQLEKYMKQRVEKLKELYDEMEPEYHRICTYEHPIDGRRNSHELWEVEEGVSPFDLPNFEELMPSVKDFKNEPDSSDKKSI